MISRELMDLLCSKTALRNELERIGARFSGNEYHCPCHKDEKASGSIYQRERTLSGSWAFRCHSCNTGGNITDLNPGVLDTKNYLPPVSSTTDESMNAKNAKRFKSIDDFIILNELHGATKTGIYNYGPFVIIRFKKPNNEKTFRVLSPDAGDYVAKILHVGLRPLYSRICNDRGLIVVVEGEKKVDALYELGTNACTSSFGAENASKSDWSSIGNREVIIWPDNDSPGYAYGNEVAASLAMIGCRSIKMVSKDFIISHLKESQDAVDYILNNAGRSVDALNTAINSATIYNEVRDIAVIGQEVHPMEIPYVDECIHGNNTNHASSPVFPWREMNEGKEKSISACCGFGSTSVIFAGTGSGKSNFIHQLLASWWIQKIPFLYIDGEMHLRDSVDRASQCAQENTQDYVDHFTKSRYSLSGMKYRDAIEVLRDRFSLGVRAFVIDSWTSLRTTDRPFGNHQEDALVDFIKELRNLNCMVWIVTHPSKSASASYSGPHYSENDMAGSAALPRTVDNIFNLTRVWGPDINKSENHYSIITTLKNRSGPWTNIAFLFQWESYSRWIYFNHMRVSLPTLKSANLQSQLRKSAQINAGQK